MDVLDLVIRKGGMKSKAWLVSRYEETEDGKIRPKLTPKYFGELLLDIENSKIKFTGSYFRIKKIKLEIPISRIISVSVIASQLKIKWRESGKYMNAVFVVSLPDANIAGPSWDAAKAWKLILDAILRGELKERLKRRRKRRRR